MSVQVFYFPHRNKCEMKHIIKNDFTVTYIDVICLQFKIASILELHLEYIIMKVHIFGALLLKEKYLLCFRNNLRLNIEMCGAWQTFQLI